MKKEKLSLKELQVKSFVTDLSGKAATVGGAYITGTTIITVTVISSSVCPDASTGCTKEDGSCPNPLDPIDVKPIQLKTESPGDCNSLGPICLA